MQKIVKNIIISATFLLCIFILLQNDAVAQNSVYRSGATPLNLKNMVRKEQQQRDYYNSQNQQRVNNSGNYYNKSSTYNNYGGSGSYNQAIIGNYSLSGRKPSNEYERKIQESRMLDQMRLNNNVSAISAKNKANGKAAYNKTLERARLAQARMEAKRNRDRNNSFVSAENKNQSYKSSNYSNQIYNSGSGNATKKPEKSGFSFVPKVFTSYK